MLFNLPLLLKDQWLFAEVRLYFYSEIIQTRDVDAFNQSWNSEDGYKWPDSGHILRTDNGIF